MPTYQHEAIGEMFKQRPELAAELLELAFDYAVPRFSQAYAGANDLPGLGRTQFRADAVSVFQRDEKPLFAAIVEVQRRPDPTKNWSWPAYMAALRARLQAPILLMAITIKQGVADWYGRPIDMGHPGWILRPLVLGPDRIPVITNVVRAARAPELTVLSVVAHPQEQSIFPALASALETFDTEHRERYLELVLDHATNELKGFLEAHMSTRPFMNSYAMEHYTNGERVGRVEGEVGSLLAIFEARGVALSDEARDQIRQCTDLNQLEAWIRRAAVGGSPEEVLA